MSKIQIDNTSAKQKATALKQASTTLMTTTAVNKDTRTTVRGNANAHETILSAKQASEKISQAVTLSGIHLQSVAKEFAALDQKLSRLLVQPFKGGN